jgi:hypothetical protein
MHVKHPVPSARSYNPQVPPYIEEVIYKAMAKNRDDRFFSAEEMARAMGYRQPFHYASSEANIRLTTLTSVQPSQFASYQAAYSGRLVLERFDGVSIPMHSATNVLGRNQINSGDLDISQRHAQITQHQGQWWLEDVGSTNGTYVNGRRISSAIELKPGDKVLLGRTQLHIKGG